MNTKDPDSARVGYAIAVWLACALVSAPFLAACAALVWLAYPPRVGWAFVALAVAQWLRFSTQAAYKGLKGDPSPIEDVLRRRADP